MYSEDMIAIEGYINFCDGFESDDESEKLKAYETYNNYFDVLDGCFEAFTIDEGNFSIATELFGGKNPFRMILDAIQAAWNWFIKKMGKLKEMIFRKKKNTDGNDKSSSTSTDSTADVEELTKQLEELKRQKEEDNKELERLTKEMEKSVNDVREAQKTASTLKERSAKEEIAKKQAEIDDLKSRNSRLENALSKTKNKLDRSRKETKNRTKEAHVYLHQYNNALKKSNYTLILNNATSKISSLINIFKKKVNESKNMINELIDNKIDDKFKPLEKYTNSGITNDIPEVKDIERYIKEIKEIEINEDAPFNDANAAYQEKINKFINTILQEVNTAKDELKNYVGTIENKKIEKNKDVIHNILMALEKDYAKLQELASKISEACCYKYFYIHFS